MSFDELEKKIISIRKRGLNILVENQLIADARKLYYTALVDKRMASLTERFRNNANFLGKLHGEWASAEKIRNLMGMELERNINQVLYEGYTLRSLYQATMVSEFYGIPLELMLFTDLQANEEILKKQYPALFRQNRD